MLGADLRTEAPDPRIEMISLDVTSEAGWAALAETIQMRWGGLHGLVNNAGSTMRVRLGDVVLSDRDRTLAINVTGPMLGMRALSGLMPSGSSIASIAAITGHFAVPYTASKWALQGLSRAASLEFGPLGIRVNTVMPGLTATAMTSDIPESVSAELLGAVSLCRPASPQDIAETVHFLLSDASGFLSGQEIAVDGGQTSHGGMKGLSDAVRRLTEAGGDVGGGS